MNGKGDTVRPYNAKIWNINFPGINWHRNDKEELRKKIIEEVTKQHNLDMLYLDKLEEIEDAQDTFPYGGSKNCKTTKDGIQIKSWYLIEQEKKEEREKLLRIKIEKALNEIEEKKND